jgi:hypothetical protein
MKDRSSRRMNMIAAKLAFIGFAALSKMMLGNAIAVFAKNTFWVLLVQEKIQTAFFIWKITLKVSNRILFHRYAHYVIR